MTDTIQPLFDGALYGLTYPVALDGRPVSTHPAWARGHAPVNSYLLVEDGEALLIDTGLPVHEAQLLADLDRLGVAEMDLSVLLLRISDFYSVSNTRTIVDRYRIGKLLMGTVRPEDFHGWLDFRPEKTGWREPTGGGKFATTDRGSLIGATTVPGPGGRELDVVRPSLQFLPSYWLYDGATRTLFASDAFTHIWRSGEEGPWVETEPTGEITPSDVADYLADARYWWLAGAQTRQIRDELAALQESHPMDCVAPAFGCVIHGRAAVDHHFALVDEALAELEERAPIGPDVIPYHKETA